MKGQWIGPYTGTNNGQVVLDLDDEGDYCRGHLYAFDDNRELPTLVVEIRTSNSVSEQVLQNLIPQPTRPGQTTLITRQVLAADYPNVIFPSTMEIKIIQAGDTASAEWTTEINTFGSATLHASQCDRPSEIIVDSSVTDWSSFREYALAQPYRQFIFRGQHIRKRLRTSFHRTRRKDLVKYLVSDIQEAHRLLTTRTTHLFNLADNGQNGAFLNLLQHHGYPTPLLDWTYSPFVAAFFAYRHADIGIDDHVRVFLFDRFSWEQDWNQVHFLTLAKPHFSMLEALSIENPRAGPQQAISSVSNVDDIESYIKGMEQHSGKSYLRAVDLPTAERDRVIMELSIMGITAGSLFPGIDGSCEELKARLF